MCVDLICERDNESLGFVNVGEYPDELIRLSDFQ